mmetsp:Transcript_33321/g.106319  ORF Transcript_33321/g.106319 Transcript_33321/m.106319 type:complete len:271 (-) Transcript_33321:6-818(-)
MRCGHPYVRQVRARRDAVRGWVSHPTLRFLPRPSASLGAAAAAGGEQAAQYQSLSGMAASGGERQPRWKPLLQPSQRSILSASRGLPHTSHSLPTMVSTSAALTIDIPPAPFAVGQQAAPRRTPWRGQCRSCRGREQRAHGEAAAASGEESTRQSRTSSGCSRLCCLRTSRWERKGAARPRSSAACWTAKARQRAGRHRSLTSRLRSDRCTAPFHRSIKAASASPTPRRLRMRSAACWSCHAPASCRHDGGTGSASTGPSRSGTPHSSGW